ncbi:MAG: zinc dependent phospholipase C family protein [Acidobacteriota bacterium]|nr:zinc dependent phospholipase C family protein [Acidobacteriota bacterium]
MITSLQFRIPRATRVTALLLLSTSVFYGYSVLTHEAIVDTLWDASLQKMLLARFPMSTPEEMEEAHAYVYGGCIIQDMGYYPFSSKLFSNLTHYVRSGDFVVALIRESEDLNEYAFALGALAHYAADNNGHPLGTNVAVPMLYPKLRRRFGKTVTYWDNPLSHLRTEFGFDVLQVAQGRYPNDQFRKFIGFKVSKPVLERAFADTYGIEMKDIFKSLDLALGTYRYSTSTVIPAMTKVAWELKKDTFIKEIPGVTRKKFLYNLSRSSYEKDYGKMYQHPGFKTRLVSWFLRVVPKSGPFKGLAFKAPTPEVEKMFMASFNATVDSYRALLADVAAKHLELVANENIDIGVPTEAGKYVGADLAYDKLLDKLADRKFVGVSADLRRNLLDYYKDRKPPPAPATAKASAAWEKVMEQRTELEQLQRQTAATQ